MAGYACTNLFWYNETVVRCNTGAGARGASGPIVVTSGTYGHNVGGPTFTYNQVYIKVSPTGSDSACAANRNVPCGTINGALAKFPKSYVTFQLLPGVHRLTAPIRFTKTLQRFESTAVSPAPAFLLTLLRLRAACVIRARLSWRFASVRHAA